jgi:hypothetical protein
MGSLACSRNAIGNRGYLEAGVVENVAQFNISWWFVMGLDLAIQTEQG